MMWSEGEPQSTAAPLTRGQPSGRRGREPHQHRRGSDLGAAGEVSGRQNPGADKRRRAQGEGEARRRLALEAEPERGRDGDPGPRHPRDQRDRLCEAHDDRVPEPDRLKPAFLASQPPREEQYQPKADEHDRDQPGLPHVALYPAVQQEPHDPGRNGSNGKQQEQPGLSVVGEQLEPVFAEIAGA